MSFLNLISDFSATKNTMNNSLSSPSKADMNRNDHVFISSDSSVPAISTPAMTPQQFRESVRRNSSHSRKSSYINDTPMSQRERATPMSQRSTSFRNQNNIFDTLNNSGGIDYAVDDPDLGDESDMGINNLPETRIWGTELNVQTCMNVFRSFVEFFQHLDQDSEEQTFRGLHGQQLTSYYHIQLWKLHSNTTNMSLTSVPLLINLNCKHLQSFPPTRVFYHQLIQYPQEIIPVLDYVLQQEYIKLFCDNRTVDVSTVPRIQVRPFNLESGSRLRDLNPENIEQLIMIKGMVIRCSSIVPDLKQAFFRCSICHVGVDIMIERGRIEEPSSCARCQTLGSMELVHNRCIFTDKQLVRLQETPDEVPEGETPYTVTLFAFDDLVDTVRPGDRVEITGIFRAVPRRTNPRMRTVKSVFKTYVDVVHFQTVGARKLDHIASRIAREETLDFLEDGDLPETNGENQHNSDESHENTMFSPSLIEQFVKFSRDERVYEKLVTAFAPSIWGMEDVKKGLLCLLFGGTLRSMKTTNVPGTSSSGVHQRGDINILLCGDPGTSKSQLLSYVHKLTPRGIYTSGKGSSAVGLTASVVRDPETHDMVLESGALVLSDRGICCIDEFDKMSDTTRAILHEAMEQQTVSITKAGIIATLNARTSILASANPVQSRYNPRLSVVENLQLPPTLLSRFDLIYLILDKPSSESDRRLATHLVSLYHDLSDGMNEEAPMTNSKYDDSTKNQAASQEFLRDYIAYARSTINPELSSEAELLLISNYLMMRSLGGRGMKTITATPRQLESLIRLSQALAKMRLSPHVLADDVIEATRLMKVATQTAATDPRTGTIDMDLISTGRTALDRELLGKLAEALRGLLLSELYHGKRLTLGQVRQLLVNEARGNNTESQNDQQFEAEKSTNMLLNITMGEVEDALKELEMDGVLQYVERTQTVLIRSK